MSLTREEAQHLQYSLKEIRAAGPAGWPMVDGQGRNVRAVYMKQTDGSEVIAFVRPLEGHENDPIPSPAQLQGAVDTAIANQ